MYISSTAFHAVPLEALGGSPRCLKSVHSGGKGRGDVRVGWEVRGGKHEGPRLHYCSHQGSIALICTHTGLLRDILYAGKVQLLSIFETTLP